MSYVDGFVLVVPKGKMREYSAMAAQAGAIWKKHGALEYRECIGDDLKVKSGCGVSFPKMISAKPGENVIFAFIVYKSRAHRDRVNAKVMKDPRIAAMGSEKMPFDIERMAYGGFEVFVDLP